MNAEYHYFKSKGRIAATVKGPRHIRGEFYIWLDSDNTLIGNPAWQRVTFGQEHPGSMPVRSDHKVAKENNLDTFLRKKGNRPKKDLFEGHFLIEDFCFRPRYYVAQTSALLKVNLNLHIFTLCPGQNILMWFPAFHKNKCDYIDELSTHMLGRKSHFNSIGGLCVNEIKRIDSLAYVHNATTMNDEICEKGTLTC